MNLRNSSVADTVRSGVADDDQEATLSGRVPSVTIVEAASSSTQEDFLVTRRIGDGGMGMVHAAEQRALGREVAIKRVRIARSAKAHRTLIQEARLLAQLEHPNIPPVHMLATDEAGAPVMVMKRIDGVSWRALVDDDDHPRWSEIKGERLVFHLQVIQQIGQALEYAHSRKILHRDVKVDNVMLGPFGEVYLLDWGVALRLDDRGCAPSTPYGGTPNYSAPEMFDEDSDLTTATDVYLLGATLHHVLVGKAIHHGDSMKAVVAQAQLSTSHEYPDTVPPALAELCTAACSADPAQRPPTIREFRNAIHDYLEHRHMLAQLHTAQLLLERLAEAIDAGGHNERDVDRLSIQCRFAFEQLLETDADSEPALHGLQSTIEAITGFELLHGNVQSARRLIAELRSLGLETKRLARLVDQLRDGERSKKQQMGELATQIQYRLVERLRDAEAELVKTAAVTDGRDPNAGD